MVPLVEQKNQLPDAGQTKAKWQRDCIYRYSRGLVLEIAQRCCMISKLLRESPINKDLIILFLCQALGITSTSLMVTSTALVGRSLAVTPELATLPYAVQFIAMFAMSFPAAAMASKFGNRYILIFGSSVLVISGAVAAFSVWKLSYVAFIFASGLFGAFSSISMRYRFAAAEVTQVGNKLYAISFVISGGVLASFCGPALAASARDAFISVPFCGSFLVLCALGVLGLLLLSFLSNPKPAAELSLELRSSRKPELRVPSFIVIVICSAVGYGSMSALMSATPLEMSDCHLSFQQTAFVIQWHIFAMYAPSLVLPLFFRRFGILNVIIGGDLLILCSVVINLLGANLQLFWSSLIVLGIGWSCMFVGATSLLAQFLADRQASKAQGLHDAVLFSFVAVSILVSGAIQSTWGWKALNLMVLPILVVAFCASLYGKKLGLDQQK